MGAGAVVCTVGTNLRDCAPFSSQEADAAYRRARASLSEGKKDEALSLFLRARDLDELRFRADSGINEALRAAARERGLPLVDVEAAFMKASPDGIPGERLLLDHVHMTYEGNELIARLLAEAVARFLPPASGPSLDPQALARRVGQNDRTLRRALADIRHRFDLAPFTGQSDHAARAAAAQARLDALDVRLTPSRREELREAVAESARAHPGDGALLARLLPLAQESDARDQELWCLQRLAAIYPDRPRLLGRLGYVLARSGGAAEAGRVLERLERLRGGSPDADRAAGLLLEALGRPAEALPRLDRALRLKPTDLDALLGKAAACAALGKTEQGLALSRRAVAAHPVSPRALFGLAVALDRSGSSAEAEAAYRGALAAEPSFLQAANNLGVLLTRTGRAEEAVGVLSEAARARPDAASVRFNLGLALHRRGDLAAALAAYSKAAALAPALPRVRYHMGLCEERRGRPQAAAALYRQELALNPRDADARGRLERIRREGLLP
jgi:tetratricopeptide (TPR) repeat protein